MHAKNYFPFKKGHMILFYFTVDRETNEFTAYSPLFIGTKNQDYRESLLELAKAEGYDVIPCKFGLNGVVRKSIMVPCTEEDQYLSPSEQIRRAIQFASGEIRAQREALMCGRCFIPAEKGMWKRCQYSVPVKKPDGTITRVRKNCDGTGKGDQCPFAAFKSTSTIIPFSELEQECETGEAVPYDIVADVSPYEDERFK